MTKNKQIAILLAAVAVLLAAYLGLKAYNDWSYKKENGEASKKLTVTDLEAGDIKKIRYTNGSNTVTFEKKEDAWEYAEDEELPLKQSYAEDAVSSFCSITGNRKLSNADTAADYGLTKPAYTVTLTDASGGETKVEIGNSTDTNYYITADSGKTIYTVSSTILDPLVFDTASLIQTETFPDIDSSSLKAFTVKQNGKTKVNCKGDDEDLATYGSELSDITLDTCINYKTKANELKQYGLDKTSRKEMTAIYGDAKKEQTFYMGTVFQEDEVDYAYLQLKGSKLVYKVFLSDTEKLIEF